MSTTEPLGSHHDCLSFSCGEPALDNYIRRQAGQDVRRRVSRVFVTPGRGPGEIAGYYTISAASIEKSVLPSKMAQKLPHYPVPVAVIGRLAVGDANQGQGLGGALLLDAVRRVIRASDAIAVYAIVVDAKNERARDFYRRYGFAPLSSPQHRLFLPLQTFERLGL